MWFKYAGIQLIVYEICILLCVFKLQFCDSDLGFIKENVGQTLLNNLRGFTNVNGETNRTESVNPDRCGCFSAEGYIRLAQVIITRWRTGVLKESAGSALIKS